MQRGQDHTTRRVLRERAGLQLEVIEHTGPGAGRVVGYFVRGRSRAEHAAFDTLTQAEAHFALLGEAGGR